MDLDPTTSIAGGEVDEAVDEEGEGEEEDGAGGGADTDRGGTDSTISTTTL